MGSRRKENRVEKYYSGFLYLKASKLDSCSTLANMLLGSPNKNLTAPSAGKSTHISLPVPTHCIFFLEVAVLKKK